MKFFTIIILFIASFSSVKAQKLTYHVFSDDHMIGTITAVKLVRNNEVVYESESRLTLRMILKFEFYSYIKTTFQNGLMLSSNSFSTLNKKPKANCRSYKSNSGYLVIADDEKHTIADPITSTGMLLFFQEPEKNEMLFSEVSGYRSYIKKTDAHEYQLTDSKTDKKNKYLYKNGVLDRADIHYSFFDLTVQRAE